MTKVVFIIDLEEGHLLPTFSFANSLKQAGYDVAYLTFADSEELVRNAGFEFYEFFPNHYPRGFKNEYNLLVVNDDHRGFDKHFGDFVNGAFDKTLAEIGGDVFIVSSFLIVEVLFIYYKYGLKSIILSPRLYESSDPLCDICAAEILTIPADETLHLLDFLAEMNLNFSTFHELVAPLASLTHLILCSKEFDKRSIQHNSRTFYLGCGGNYNDFVGLTSIPEAIGKKIIYASMGSQIYMYVDKLSLLFSKLADVMDRDAMKEYHLIFSLGGSDLNFQIETAASNISLKKWVNQRDVLTHSCIALVHGGLSTIKECIYASVPMIVLPGSRDQPENAQRVKEHGLGIVVDILTITSDNLLLTMLEVIGNQGYKRNLVEMKNKFEEEDRQMIGVSIINKIHSGENLG